MTELEGMIAEIRRATDPEQRAALLQGALEHTARDRDPLLWANLNHDLATSLMQTESGNLTAPLFDKICTALQAALTVYTPEATPADWAMMQICLGIMHLDAAHARIGDEASHVEVGIATLSRALEIPVEQQASEVRRTCQIHLGRALAIAADWRGPSAFVDAARTMAAALEAVDKTAEPELWATLELRIAKALFESGASEHTEEAIAAGENALSVLDRERRPLEWAEAHATLGALYGTRPSGTVSEKMERAIASLDKALSVLGEDADSRLWYRAHHNRGISYFHRVQGDRRENRRHALDSLQIAIKANPRPQDDTWAAVNCCMGWASLELGEIEHAIAAFERALSVQSDHAVRSSRAYAALGHAYLCRRESDDAENRTRAIACFEAALILPAEQWPNDGYWFRIQACLHALYLGKSAEVTPTSRPSGAPPLPPLEPIAGDPFDQRSQQNAYAEEVRLGSEPLPHQPGWRVPTLLNEGAHMLRRNLVRFIETETREARPPALRSELEVGRWHLFRDLLSEALEKRAAAHRAQRLLQAVEQGTQPFVLFLRGFVMRAARYSSVTVMKGGGESLHEPQIRKHLVNALAPVPLLWVANPVDSGTLELALSGLDSNGTGYRIEASETWETDVRSLISAASFIVVHYSADTPGMATELRLLEELGRADDVLVYDRADSARAFNDEVLASMRATAKSRRVEPGSLPAASSRWLEGSSRTRLASEARGTKRWVLQLAKVRSPLSVELELDASFFLMAALVLLEELEQLPALMRSVGDAYRVLVDGGFEEATQLAEAYPTLARRLDERLSAPH